jgi:transcriptional regulator with XRE-family HTH domain
MESSRKSTLRERGAALREFRVANDITQAQLGKMADLAESSISRFESGDRDLSPEAEVRVEQAKAAMTAGRYVRWTRVFELIRTMNSTPQLASLYDLLNQLYQDERSNTPSEELVAHAGRWARERGEGPTRPGFYATTEEFDRESREITARQIKLQDEHIELLNKRLAAMEDQYKLSQRVISHLEGIGKVEEAAKKDAEIADSKKEEGQS